MLQIKIFSIPFSISESSILTNFSSMVCTTDIKWPEKLKGFTSYM